MEKLLILSLSVFIVSCAGGGKKSVNSDCRPVRPFENLSPYIGKCVILRGEVTENDYLSIKDYWIPIPELSEHRGAGVSVTGIVRTRKESAGRGNEQQSGRGVYYIEVKSIERLK